MSTNPRGNRAPAVRYRVGALGELKTIPAEGLPDTELYALLTMTGVEWYDSTGNWTAPPGFSRERLADAVTNR